MLDLLTADPITLDASPIDPGVDRLLFLARHFGRNAEAGQITAGLPLENGRMGPASLLEGAARIGLAVSAGGMGPGTVKSSMLPALVLGEDDALVVLHRKGDLFECASVGVEPL